MALQTEVGVDSGGLEIGSRGGGGTNGITKSPGPSGDEGEVSVNPRRTIGGFALVHPQPAARYTAANVALHM